VQVFDAAGRLNFYINMGPVAEVRTAVRRTLREAYHSEDVLARHIHGAPLLQEAFVFLLGGMEESVGFSFRCGAHSGGHVATGRATAARRRELSNSALRAPVGMGRLPGTTHTAVDHTRTAFSSTLRALPKCRPLTAAAAERLGSIRGSLLAAAAPCGAWGRDSYQGTL